MITKEEASKAYERENADKVAALEETIDRELMDRYEPDSRFYGVTVATRGVPYKLIETIKRRYSEGGWRVEYVSDQRDGDFLKFS